MKFLANPRPKRNIAVAMVLVWLFALASGVANACFLEVPASHSGPAKLSAATGADAPAELLAHDGASAGHHDEPDSTKDSCLKVCADGEHTLPNAYSGIDHTDPGPAPLVATLRAESPELVLALGRREQWAIPVVGPPFRVRYSRLAL